MLRRKAGMAAAAAARVVPVAAVAVAVQVGAVAAAVQAVAAAPRVVVAVVRVQVAAVAAPAVRVAAAAVRVEAVTAAVEVQVAGMSRTAPVVEARAEAARVAARATAVAPKVADVIVRVITTRRVLLVSARAIGSEMTSLFVIETEIEIVIVIERGIVIETETVIEAGKETLAAVFANGNAIASVTKTGEENVSVAAPSIPPVGIRRPITAAMDTVQTRLSKAIRTACTRARTMRAGARVMIRAAHTFTSMAPAGFYPSSAVRLRTARPIAMVFCADMKRGTSATRCILPVAAFIDSTGPE